MTAGQADSGGATFPPAASGRDERPRILVCDDEPAIRSLARAFLEQIGADVLEAADGVEALAVFGRERLDLVLLDVTMPRKDGFATLQELRALPAGGTLPVVIITALDDQHAIRRAYELGATDFVTKPIHWSILRARVQYILRASRAFAQLERSRARLRILALAVEQSPASVVITDPRGNIEYVNPTFEDVTGYTLAEVVGKNPRFLKSGLMSDDIYHNLWASITAGKEWRGELQNRRKNGELFWESARVSPLVGEDGTVLNFVAMKEDITIRKEYEERLIHQANFDELTGLPNRLLAFDRLGRALVASRQGDRSVAVLFLDLDNFKGINESFGHADGDQLLRSAASRLRGATDEADTVARLGGDEFLVIVPGAAGAAGAETAARRLLDDMAAPIDLGGREVFVNASVGIAVAPADGYDPHLLLRFAETAMYRAKRRSGSSLEFFAPAMNEQAAERLLAESHLRRALDNREFFLHYQPICDALSGTIVAVEALLRWCSPELGMVPPNRFIPLAEGSGLIVAIGTWVLRTACKEAVHWSRLGPQPPRLAVNISPRQFDREDFVGVVAAALTDSGLPPGRLELEITERLLVDDQPDTHTILRQLRDMGVRLALDDFGTGQSSLGYLRRFRLDTLKIDRAFVGSVPHEPEGSALVTAIVAMGRALGLQVLAEGVETQPQLDFLSLQGCDLVQGYLLGRPVGPEEIAARLGGEAGGSAAVV